MTGDPRIPRSQPSVAAAKSTEGFGARLASRALRKGINAAKPLVPLTSSHKNGGSHPNQNNGLALHSLKESEADKKDNIDAGPAAHDGRSFTVSNVGNNGRIYLRPSVRRPNQQSPPTAFQFPVTPPGTAGFSATPTTATNPPSTQWAATSKEPTGFGARSKFAELRNLARPKLRRAISDSTIHDAPASRADIEPSQPATPIPGDNHRPRTMDDLDAFTTPVLNINIPSWRIGTPRFTMQGTPLIRGSSYAPTEDFRSSGASGRNRLPGSSNGRIDLGWTRHPTSSSSFHNRGVKTGSSQDHTLAATGSASARLIDATRSTFASYAVIEPEMFTPLTFPPACANPAIVRYSSHSKAVTAATPPRLVAEITSPSFLDYELISDFFLTYRAFLEPLDLTRMLFARMQWALTRQDEVGMIVRVRTFVAVRHWVLNYFMDDFVLDYDLRCVFCQLLNNIVHSLSDNPQRRLAQLKVIVELKKCWRRICAHYWDGPDFDENLDVEVPIVPGGIAGSRDPNSDPSFWENNGIQNPIQLSPSLPSPVHLHPKDASKTAPISDFVVIGNRPMTPENIQRIDEHAVESPRSASSLDVLSCAFPMKGIKNTHANPTQLLGVHPVPSAALSSNPAAVATAPKALMRKRSQLTHSHKRSNSMSDSLREHLSAKRPSQEHDGLVAVSSARSLVRGNVLPPGQAFVDMPSSHHGRMHRQTTVFQAQGRKMFFKDRAFASAMSAAGMKRLLGSVRKAISNRGQPASPSQANLMDFTPVSPPGATSNSLDVRTAVVPQNQIRQNGTRPVVRIDLLGAEVAEDFKAAVRGEDHNVASPDSEQLSASVSVEMDLAADPSMNHQHPTTPPQGPLPQLPNIVQNRPVSDSGVTNGSRSIVIRPDSNVLNPHIPLQRESGVLPSANSYVESFQPATGDPTPPNTPPTQSGRDVPRRSSYLLNQHVLYPTITADDAPPLPLLQRTSTLGQSSIGSQEVARRSLSVNGRFQRHPSSSQGTFRQHRRTRSSRTRSMSSLTQRTYSGELLPATTYNPLKPFRALPADEDEQDEDEDDSSVAAPEPLRVLRRRPGGDLKAAKDVNDLQHRLLGRSQSVGSFATYTDSMRSSWIASPEPDSDFLRDNKNNFARELSALGQVARDAAMSDQEEPLHSSKPPLRPSFEAQTQKLRQIADDEGDDGIDAALRKLEGRYDGKSKSNRNSGDGNDEDEEVDIEKLGQALQNLAGGAPEEPQYHDDIGNDDRESIEQADTPRGTTTNVVEVNSFLSGASTTESRFSVPLLERDAEDESRYTFGPKEWTDRSVYNDADDMSTTGHDDSNVAPAISENEHGQAYLVEQESTQPTEQEDQSFLDDESVAGTDLSSEMSDENADGNMLGDHVAYFSSPELPSNPLGASYPEPLAAPLSPSQSTPRPPMSPKFVKQPQQTGFTQTMLPTPDATPTAPSTQTMPPTSQPAVTTPLESPRPAPQPDATFRKFSVHLPFILAFDSDVLAQQFTLIEKDALNEIDWKDLIDMNWKNTASSSSRSWVDFLRNSEAHGVEVVIARFNIMVKWAISEIVLTQNIEERARCVIKMIHIASHCRRYRNFATLAQLTIALTSNEVGRLSKTWDMVPSSDLKTLESLEALVTPTRNFFHLRAEMEVGTDTGCIPFVGIYTHDLLYNAQRPSEIATSPTAAPLVNFERCRIAAAVIKVLLRLLESSTHYKFQPLEGVTERCLWVGALSDDDIRRHSSGLE